MDIRKVSWYLGVFLVVSGVLSFLPVPVALYYHEPILMLVIRIIVFWSVGMVFMHHPREHLDFRGAMFLIALSMLILPLIGVIPFFQMFEGGFFEVMVNGYFEGVSGYTTSGLTVFSQEQLSPDSPSYRHSFVFSRTLMEWTGGLGIIVIFLSLLARGGMSTVFLYRVEGGERIVPSIDHTTKIILRIYLFYTFTGAILLWLFDMSPLYALSTMMSVLSTGGFISLVGGINITPLAEIVILVFLILAAIPFTLDYVLLSGNLKKFFGHLEIRFGCWIMFFSLIFFMAASLTNGGNFLDSLHRNIILIIASITTGGYHLGILDGLHGSEIFLVIILMLVGGGAGSTAGGLKLIRVGVLSGAIRWFIKKLSLPESAVFPFKVGKNVFSGEELRNIALFFFIYVVLILFGTFSIIAWGVGADGGVELQDALLLSVSAQGNVGFSTIDIMSQSLIVKLVLIFQMIAGRLEIFPILALIGCFVKYFGHEVVEIEKEIIEKEKEIMRRKDKDKALEDELKVLKKIMRIGEDE